MTKKYPHKLTDSNGKKYTVSQVNPEEGTIKVEKENLKMSENFESTYKDSIWNYSTSEAFEKSYNDSIARGMCPSSGEASSGTDTIYFGDPRPAQDYWYEDGYSLTGNPHYAPDTISFNVKMPEDTNKNGFWKYEEDKTLKQIEEYLVSTYKSHYTSEQSKTQTLDLIESIGDAEPFTRSNAIKYLSRFGKKNGKSKQDILKAIHYCILLYHFAGLHKNKTDQYNY